jgi:hypothetical protein
METCPECQGKVESDLTCHTWPRNLDDGTKQWMACIPCDSATRWNCVAIQPEDIADEWYDPEEDEGSGCGWSWTEGLNPQNPRAEANDTKNPKWE